MFYYLREYDVLFRSPRHPPDRAVRLEKLSLRTGRWEPSLYRWGDRELEFVKPVSQVEASELVKGWGLVVEGL
jgi:hypothetical protein